MNIGKETAAITEAIKVTERAMFANRFDEATYVALGSAKEKLEKARRGLYLRSSAMGHSLGHLRAKLTEALNRDDQAGAEEIMALIVHHPDR